MFLALLFSKSGRVHLRRPGIYLAAIVALIVFSPVIVWNQRHDWASFRFQLAHGLESQDRSGLRMFSEWLGGQALIFTPVLFVLTIFVLGKFWLDYRKLDLQKRLLLWCASVPLLFFGYSGFRARGEPNWPAFAYFPASLLLAKYVSERWQGARWNWTMIGCIVAFGGFLAVQFLEPFWMMKIPRVKKMDGLVGWRDFGRQIDAVARGAPVIANRHQDAGEAAFYMNGQPDVWASSVGSRPTAFDYMRGGPDISSLPRVLFLGSHDEEFVRKYGFIPGATGRFTGERHLGLSLGSSAAPATPRRRPAALSTTPRKRSASARSASGVQQPRRSTFPRGPRMRRRYKSSIGSSSALPDAAWIAVGIHQDPRDRP